MAATTAVLMSRIAAGRPHVVAVRPLYGGTDALLASGLLGTSVSFVEPGHIAAAVTDATGLVVMESPSNPTLELYDIRAWKRHPEHRAAQQRGIDDFYEHYSVTVAEVTRQYGSVRSRD